MAKSMKQVSETILEKVTGGIYRPKFNRYHTPDEAFRRSQYGNEPIHSVEAPGNYRANAEKKKAEAAAAAAESEVILPKKK